MLSRILIAGRPNVGKSSLMNALLGYRRSIVWDVAGTTQDELCEKFEWDGKQVELVDGQGIDSEADEGLVRGMLSRADACVFLVDARSGILPMDRWLAEEIRRAEIPVLLGVNKAESLYEDIVWDFAELGFEEMLAFSAAHRLHTDKIKDWCVSHALPTEVGASEGEMLTISILGRPNAGKSTLMNRLCGEAVSKVSPVAMTTRDAVAHEVEYGGRRFRLLDTAGIRRRKNRKEPIEVFSIHASKRALRESDLVFLLLRSTEELTDQDKKLLALIEEEGKPTVIFPNFWDLLDGESRRLFLRELKFYVAAQPYTVEPISAATGWHADRCLKAALKLSQHLGKRITTSRLNDRMKQIISRNPPPVRGTGNFNLLYVSQVKETPPTFVFFGNRQVPESYRRYLKNEIRKEFGFHGTPLRLLFREKR
ncbi:MAG: ribosome biogenesis GTPase Der [Bdellovibrionales bacterium]|nr:ribosome biogenesis GTPase Der [Bdellovibrionales bacterium]